MGAMFAGLLFLSINVNIAGLCVTPDFIGYILLAYGMKKVKGNEEPFRKRRNLPLYLIPVGMLDFAMLCIGLTSFITTVLFVAAKMSVLWAVASWAAMLEEASEYDLGAGKLMSAWQIELIAYAAALVTVWLPLVSTAASIVVFIATIYYLAMFWRFRKNWTEDETERKEETV